MVTLKKYHGLGNDYLIYDPNQNRELLQERQIQLLKIKKLKYEFLIRMEVKLREAVTASEFFQSI